MKTERRKAKNRNSSDLKTAPSETKRSLSVSTVNPITNKIREKSKTTSNWPNFSKPTESRFYARKKS